MIGNRVEVSRNKFTSALVLRKKQKSKNKLVCRIQVRKVIKLISMACFDKLSCIFYTFRYHLGLIKGVTHAHLGTNNSVSFKTFRRPLFLKPVSWLGLFCRFLQQDSSTLHCWTICCLNQRGKTLPERIYNPITAMGFSAMFTFKLDNTKR
jgi:hypothetical protein